ncbi:MAG TPA: hypothetical protein VMT20_09220 [Terriglobia bacterium]|nr:hypothetical protein [Terriglobia bacterium]
MRSFTVENANMAEALLALRSSDVDHIIIGFERMPHLPGEKGGPISVALTGGTVGQIVQRLCEADPRYEYEVLEGAMVVVRPQNATTDPSDLLNLEIQTYTIDAKVGAGEAIEHVWEDAPELRSLLRRKLEERAKRTGESSGFPGSIMSGNMPPPRFTLHLHNVTVRQILDAISLKSVDMFRQGPDYGPNGMPLKMAPTGWEYDFTVDPNAPNGLGGYPKWTPF